MPRPDRKLLQQVESLFEWLTRPRTQKRRAIFTRDVRVSEQARSFVFGAGRTTAEQQAFAELLLKLDSDPTRYSQPILPRDPANPSLPPGLRWARFGNYNAILLWDLSRNRISIINCE